ncbi:prenylcysteine oxidase 1 [Lepidopterella palustris CBS 459.81]|uniref:Prenylcysteine oxidase 1 n=1 Tax=Lepidopterella palustris CBS 459.81 TaxID=1314670 RepID=A0A8E2E7E3_9PEZI|nr:prenylcysteine oxidase 1 [Lepidopterella palustris CBS 459.81]
MSARRVAIIGAGAGGSSAAYYLSQNAHNLGIKANITVFERSPYVGGRSTTVHVWDDPHLPIELGASIFVKVNKVIVSAVETFNLSIDSSADRLGPENAPELGIWNGYEFVLRTTAGNGWWDTAKLLWRYGLAPIKTNNLMKATTEKFFKMYDEPHFPFHSLTKVAYDLGLTAVTAATGEQYLQENGIGALFANEVIQASTRVNYAQNIPLIHGLETMVCMATDGAMAVAGGNWQIFDEMLRAAKADVRLNTTVSSLSRQKDGSYILGSKSPELSSIAEDTFDAVILTAPYQFSGIGISPLPKHIPNKIPYVQLHVTLFASPHKLSPLAFGLDAGTLVPRFVLTTLAPDEHYGNDPNGVGKPGFFSISIVGGGLNPSDSAKDRPEYIYKIFSPRRINSSFLSNILGVAAPADEEDELSMDEVSWVYRKVWNSYPYEYPRVTFEEIKLDEGLWYTSGIESFISTMETSALMGMNVARMVADEWAGEKENAAEKVAVVQEEEKEYARMNEMGQKPIKAKL